MIDIVNGYVPNHILWQWLPSSVCFIGPWTRSAVCMPRIVVHTFET